jgi:hypothetical protein
MRAFAALIFGCLLVAAAPAYSAGKAMTGDELTALLANGKTIMLGGPGTGYSGTLTLNADGTGHGSAQTDDGKTHIALDGTWEIRDGKFCRLWKDRDDNKEVCETWVKAGTNKVNVMDGKKKIGVNFW